MAGKYAAVADRESAYELFRQAPRGRADPEEAPAPEPKQGRQPKEEEGLVEKVVSSGAFRSMLRSAGTVIGREITRSIFGTSRRRR